MSVPRHRIQVAVIGTGISGMAAAWLLSPVHEVTVFEQEYRLGGHSNTVDVPMAGGTVPVDTGFIVYNPVNYPNFSALLDHLNVETRPSEMSFAVSRHGGRLEYAGNGLSSLFAQWRNAFRPEFWRMLRDLRRFYRYAPAELSKPSAAAVTLGQYLQANKYGQAFRDDHLLPMAAAIWSAPPDALLDYPLLEFVRFFENHGLLQLRNRPEWRTVVGGSRSYIDRLTQSYAQGARLGRRVDAVTRTGHGIFVKDSSGLTSRFDHVVIASHADQALRMLTDADAHERSVLGAFKYTKNLAVLHSDASLMPRRRAVWSSWNYMHRRDANDARVCISYWMNRLQGFSSEQALFVTLNPDPHPDPGRVIYETTYEHPVFGLETAVAQRQLWSLQGKRNTWFCGAYFGAGFHEDGLQAGLAVAEDLGKLRRPWNVEGQSNRIFRGATTDSEVRLELAS